MYEIISFLKRSKNRSKILKSVQDEPRIPTEISRELNIHKSAVSRGLKELKEKDLIECLTPKQKKGRLYYITDKGKKALKKL